MRVARLGRCKHIDDREPELAQSIASLPVPVASTANTTFRLRSFFSLFASFATRSATCMLSAPCILSEAIVGFLVGALKGAVDPEAIKRASELCDRLKASTADEMTVQAAAQLVEQHRRGFPRGG